MRHTAEIVAVAVITALVTAAATYTAFHGRLERLAQTNAQLAAQLDLQGETIDTLRRGSRTAAIGAGVTSATANVLPTPGNPSQEPDQAELVDLIRQVVRDERQNRLATITAQQQQRVQAWRVNRDGPYGRFNARVNGLADRLELDPSQAAFYHELLQEYDARAKALYQQLDVSAAGDTDAETFQARLEHAAIDKETLDREFDAAFEQTLTPQQAERFRALPEEERGVGPGSGLSGLNVPMAGRTER